MHPSVLPLSALRAFEAAARHSSLTSAARELHVTASALSHQIRGLEELLGVKLFERRVRAIALTAAGKQLYPGLQTGFAQIREAIDSFAAAGQPDVLVVSTSPGLTSKWLAPRLYRFGAAHPDIDVRISSSLNNANFTTDRVDLAVRNMSVSPAADRLLDIEKLYEVSFVPVCSRALLDKYGPVKTARDLARLPLIHDETLKARVAVADWSDWFKAAGVADVDLRRGLRFNSSDHALDAAGEGAGVLLAHDLLAYDDLRTGRLVVPVKLSIAPGRAFHLVRLKARRPTAAMTAFAAWLRKEIAALDWRGLKVKRLALL
ncbi:MAG TPA: transcriptional regulator GcvA [Pseudolabrys sp.]|nr:transcriptional regulator GcvA [Pseudolabrys sp.]